jgi:hypothetical protein
MGIHLSTRDDLAALLQTPVKARNRRTHGARGHDQACEDFKRRAQSRRQSRCTCGVCYACTENARWDRIFNEKFADPLYYRDRSPAMTSPLASA